MVNWIYCSNWLSLPPKINIGIFYSDKKCPIQCKRVMKFSMSMWKYRNGWTPFLSFGQQYLSEFGRNYPVYFSSSVFDCVRREQVWCRGTGIILGDRFGQSDKNWLLPASLRVAEMVWVLDLIKVFSSLFISAILCDSWVLLIG